MAGHHCNKRGWGLLSWRFFTLISYKMSYKISYIFALCHIFFLGLSYKFLLGCWDPCIVTGNMAKKNRVGRFFLFFF